MTTGAKMAGTMMKTSPAMVFSFAKDCFSWISFAFPKLETGLAKRVGPETGIGLIPVFRLYIRILI